MLKTVQQAMQPVAQTVQVTVFPGLNFPHVPLKLSKILTQVFCN